MPHPDFYKGDQKKFLTFIRLANKLSRLEDLDSLCKYKPTPLEIYVWADPDPLEFRLTQRYNDALYEYLRRQRRYVKNLSWAERFLLSHGIVPDRILLTSHLHKSARDLIEGQFGVEFVKLMRSELGRGDKPRPIRIIEGLRVGEIIRITDLKKSKKHQRLAIVDVGEVKPRQIVCAGENVLQPGHKVLVALPGAKYMRVDVNGSKEKGVIRVRKYKNLGGIISEGVLCSAAEGSPIFRDGRNPTRDQVCILPNDTPYKPGTILDRKVLSSNNFFIEYAGE